MQGVFGKALLLFNMKMANGDISIKTEILQFPVSMIKHILFVMVKLKSKREMFLEKWICKGDSLRMKK